jgi:type II secretory pathway predicted ATPase ExeA
MYCKFFNLVRKPFEITIDPRFYYSTAQHKEAANDLRTICG